MKIELKNCKYREALYEEMFHLLLNSIEPYK